MITTVDETKCNLVISEKKAWVSVQNHVALFSIEILPAYVVLDDLIRNVAFNCLNS